MRNNKSSLLSQKHIPLVGEFKQLLGGAMSWATIFIFFFTGIMAWNSDTLSLVRDHLPWLNLGIFSAVLVAGIVILMWLEHKWFQPSVMAYWNQMNYNQNNPQKEDHRRIESKLDLLLTHLSRTSPELDSEYKGLMSEFPVKKD